MIKKISLFLVLIIFINCSKVEPKEELKVEVVTSSVEESFSYLPNFEEQPEAYREEEAAPVVLLEESEEEFVAEKAVLKVKKSKLVSAQDIPEPSDDKISAVIETVVQEKIATDEEVTKTVPEVEVIVEERTEVTERKTPWSLFVIMAIALVGYNMVKNKKVEEVDCNIYEENHSLNVPNLPPSEIDKSLYLPLEENEGIYLVIAPEYVYMGEEAKVSLKIHKSEMKKLVKEYKLQNLMGKKSYIKDRNIFHFKRDGYGEKVTPKLITDSFEYIKQEGKQREFKSETEFLQWDWFIKAKELEGTKKIRIEVETLDNKEINLEFEINIKENLVDVIYVVEIPKEIYNKRKYVNVYAYYNCLKEDIFTRFKLTKENIVKKLENGGEIYEKNEYIYMFKTGVFSIGFNDHQNNTLVEIKSDDIEIKDNLGEFMEDLTNPLVSNRTIFVSKWQVKPETRRTRTCEIKIIAKTKFHKLIFSGNFIIKITIFEKLKRIIKGIDNASKLAQWLLLYLLFIILYIVKRLNDGKGLRYIIFEIIAITVVFIAGKLGLKRLK